MASLVPARKRAAQATVAWWIGATPELEYTEEAHHRSPPEKSEIFMREGEAVRQAGEQEGAAEEAPATAEEEAAAVEEQQS